jgi:hypothetical protein
VANPLSRRLLQLAGLLSLLLIAVVVNYLLHDGGEVLNPVAEAAQRTAAQPGARLKMDVTYSAVGATRTVTGSGTGVYNARSGRTAVDFVVPIPGRAPLSVRAVGDERTTYTRAASISAELPPGKKWLGMEILLGHDPAKALDSGPGAAGTLEMLKAVGGGVEELDHESVRGHRTTRYKTTIDLAHVGQLMAERGESDLAREYERTAEEAPGPIPVEVWIDGNGLLRLSRMVMQLPTGDGGPTVSVDMRMEFFDFGIHPRVKLPPKRKVFDYTPVLRAELGLNDGSNLGPLAPPAGTAPLSAAEFHHRMGAICRASQAAARRLTPKAHRVIGRFRSLTRSQVLAGDAKPLLVSTGRWFEDALYRLGLREFRKMVALAPPPSYAARYRRYLELEAEEGEWILALARSFQLGAFKVPNSSNHEAEHRRSQRERKKIAHSLGFHVCEGNVGDSALHAEAA